MNVSGLAISTLLLLNAALAGASLRGALTDESRGAAADGMALERRASAVNPRSIPIRVSIGPSVMGEPPTPVAMIELRGAVVSLAIAGTPASRPEIQQQPDDSALLHAAVIRAPDPSIRDIRPSTGALAPTGRFRVTCPSTTNDEPGRDVITTGRRQWPTQVPAQIIFAHNGSIVMVGDSGRLTANTGATSASGVVAVGVEASTLTTGTSRPSAITVSRPQLAALAGGTSAASTPHANMSFLGVFPRPGASGKSGVAVSGFEDHSVSVIGNDEIVTYDDSNVFIDRNGDINANTGDTDSSGLNVVDVIGSRIRSGNSGDAEGSDDDEDAQQHASGGETAEEEADISIGGSGASGSMRRAIQVKAIAQALPREPGAPDQDVREPRAEENDDEQDLNYPALQKGQSFATVTDEGASAAIGDNPFVVGADGFDDVSIRTSGDRNIVTYDDSNVVIGGIGKVNAEIGDSDTGGTIAMSVRNSIVEGGCEGDLCYSDVEARREPRPPEPGAGRSGLDEGRRPARERRIPGKTSRSVSTVQANADPHRSR